MITLDLTAAANMLHMSEDALMRHARSGRIPGCKPGRQWVFLEVDLIEWMRSQYGQEKRPKATKACRSLSVVKSGGSTSAIKDAELGALLKQVIRRGIRFP